MDRMEFYIYFEKSVWIGLCIHSTNCRTEAAHYIFGKEPSNAEILDFYLNKFDRMKFVQCSTHESENLKKLPVAKSSFKKSLHKVESDQNKGAGEAFRIYNEGLAVSLEKNKLKKSLANKISEKEKYRKKRERKKRKKKGH